MNTEPPKVTGFVPSPLANQRIVLLGVGHTNAHILRMWSMAPIADCELVCVSNFGWSTYSGMLPGVLSGQYPRAMMQVDLVRLAASARARLIVANVRGLDLERHELLFDDRVALPFDLLSIGIGSVPKLPQFGENSPAFITIKPMQTFLDRLDARLRQCVGNVSRDRPLRLVVVGGGAGGLEILMCLPPYVRRVCGDIKMALSLVSGASQVPVGVRSGTAARVQRIIDERGIAIHHDKFVVAVHDDAVECADGTLIPADVVLWAPSANAPPLLGTLGLKTDERGFLATRPTLQSLSSDQIFAVGDSGTIEGQETPKAGVYAVRQGPVLWNNLQRMMSKQPLAEYRPQANFLKLLNTGDGRGIGEYYGISWLGRSAWRLKDRIDSKFMQMFHRYQPAEMPATMPPTSAETGGKRRMRCTGCGAKISGDVLSAVLRELKIETYPHVLVGLDTPDDATVLDVAQVNQLVLSTDFFSVPLNDLYVSGRIAALNALSDLYAMDAVPTTALAMVGLPTAGFTAQRRAMTELLAGSLHEFRQAGVALAGGHSIEQEGFMIGFTVIGNPRIGKVATKRGLRAGDQLILTKPLGTGVLLAAHGEGACQAEWFATMLNSMLISNGKAMRIRQAQEASAITDVTGFGLAGHLLEMLQASHMGATLRLSAIPLLPGAAELSDEGWESTLAPGNRHVESEMQTASQVAQLAAYRLLFDPQTSGGLLLGVPAEQGAALTEELARDGHCCAVIGEVCMASKDQRRLTIIS